MKGDRQKERTPERKKARLPAHTASAVTSNTGTDTQLPPNQSEQFKVQIFQTSFFGPIPSVSESNAQQNMAV